MALKASKKSPPVSPHTCQTCQKPVSKAGVARCRACWLGRGASDAKLPPALCVQCGKPTARRAAKLCRACWKALGTPVPAGRLQTYDEAKVAWDAFIGRTKPPAAESQKRPYTAPGLTKSRVLLVSDLHIPFHEPAFLEYLLTVSADRLIVAGDFLDCYSLSRFVRYEQVPYQTEWAQAQLVLDLLAQTYPQVDMIVGNHEARLEKQLRSHLSEDMVEAVRLLTHDGTLDPLRGLIRAHSNVRCLSHTTPEGAELGWLTQIGDTIIGHAEVWSEVPGAALRRWEERLDHHRDTWGLEPYRLVLLPHTHALASVPWRGNKLLVETGCLCTTANYMLQPRGSKRPQQRGYVQYTQDSEGRTDLNSLHIHYFDLE